MPKPTLADVLAARQSDPRALRGAITVVGGKTRLVFPAVGEFGRFSVVVSGSTLKTEDDPRDALAADAPASDGETETAD